MQPSANKDVWDLQFRNECFDDDPAVGHGNVALLPLVIRYRFVVPMQHVDA